MKFLRLLFLAALLLRLHPAAASENRYDVLAHLLKPFIDVLAQNSNSPNRAVQLTAEVERMTDLPPSMLGTRLELSLQAPDRLRIHGPIAGELLTVCRDGQQLWVIPGTRAQALIDLALRDKQLPKADPSFRLQPFRLPIPEKQLVFLPALFQVIDRGSEEIGGVFCRVLDLTLMPELIRSLKLEGWSARVWVRPDGTPARLTVSKADWQITLKLDAVAFQPSLPETTWKAPADADVLTMSAARFHQLQQAFIK